MIVNIKVYLTYPIVPIIFIYFLKCLSSFRFCIFDVWKTDQVIQVSIPYGNEVSSHDKSYHLQFKL